MKSRIRHSNAREPEQLLRMRRLASKKMCFFCKDNYLKVGASPAIHHMGNWYIKKNDYPYAGSRYHYLIANTKHFTKISEISPKSWQDLLKAIKWLEKHLKVKGGSFFARFGDLLYTGATFDHLHFHFLVGGPWKKNTGLEENLRVTLGHKI